MQALSVPVGSANSLKEVSSTDLCLYRSVKEVSSTDLCLSVPVSSGSGSLLYRSVSRKSTDPYQCLWDTDLCSLSVPESCGISQLRLLYRSVVSACGISLKEVSSTDLCLSVPVGSAISQGSLLYRSVPECLWISQLSQGSLCACQCLWIRTLKEVSSTEVSCA